MSLANRILCKCELLKCDSASHPEGESCRNASDGGKFVGVTCSPCYKAKWDKKVRERQGG